MKYLETGGSVPPTAPEAGPSSDVTWISGVDELLCKGCGRCVAACRAYALTLETAGERGVGKKTAGVAEDRCSGCGRCAETCHFGAIRVR